MIRGGIVIFFALFLSFPLLSQTARELTVRDIVARESPSILRIDVVDDSGDPVAQATGIVIRTDGVIVTNEHVLENGCDISIKSAAGVRLKVASLLFASKDKDLAVIQIDGVRLPSATLGNSSSLVVGQKLIAIGNPMGLEHSVSDGIVSALRKVGSDTFIQTTAAISPGSSGGGLYTERGGLVGITTFTLRDSQNLNFAIPIDTVKSLLAGGAMSAVDWAVASAKFCSASTLQVDSLRITGLVGRSLTEEVQATLRELNGGMEPIYSTAVFESGEYRSYQFRKLGVQLNFKDGVASNAVLYGHEIRDKENKLFAREFRGSLPLGLAWRMTPTEVHQGLGRPTNLRRSGDSRTAEVYSLGRFTYYLRYSERDELEEIEIVQRLD